MELNSEGLKSYRSNGDVVLNTDTSDGSIDMMGQLSQTIGDRTITVGGDYGGGPGIIWSDSNIYVYPPGVRYGNDPGNTSVMTTLVQGPGTNSGNSYLDLVERGDGFDLRAWKGTGSSRTDWRVDARWETCYARRVHYDRCALHIHQAWSNRYRVCFEHYTSTRA